MRNKEHYILAVALFVGLAMWGWADGGWHGLVRSLGLGLVGYVIGRAVNVKT